MADLSAYLSIAGLAHRQAANRREAIADGPQHFPSGEQTFLASEIACYGAVMHLCKLCLPALSRP